MVSPLQHFPDNENNQRHQKREDFHILFGDFYNQNNNSSKKETGNFLTNLFCGTNVNEEAQQ